MRASDFAAIPLLIAAVVLVAAVALMPRRTEIVGADLRVHTWLKTFHFDLNDVLAVEDLDYRAFARSAIRVCGGGWPMNPYGWFWNRKRGMMLAMVSDRSNMVLLTMRKRVLIVSPENRELLLQGPALKRFALFHPSKLCLPGTPVRFAERLPGTVSDEQYRDPSRRPNARRSE